MDLSNREPLQVEYANIYTIKPYEKNAKTHDAEQVKKIKSSIKRFGWRKPIVVDKDGVIVCGHGAYFAAKELKLESVPVAYARDLTEKEIKAYRLADNKVAESPWDFNLLNLELAELEGFDMEDFGFDLENLEELETETEKQEVDEEDYLPEEGEPRAKAGDLYQLGQHRLICGDSTDALVIEKLMDGKKADCVFTDPPYGMKKEKDGIKNDNLSYDKLLEFNKQWIPITFDNLKDTGCWYCWGIDEPLMDIYSEILKPMEKENKVVIRNYITWAKKVAQGIGGDFLMKYPSETEKCWFVMKGQDWNNNNIEFFNTKYQRLLDYMQGEAQKANLRPKDVERVCKCQMYKHWFTKSQFAIIPERHYESLRQEYEGCFTEPYENLRNMLGESNNTTADLKPYFDAEAIDDYGGIGLTDVWRIPPTGTNERKEAAHATPKPIGLCSMAIHASTRKGEIVLDVFGGSGSTLLACEKLGRKGYLCEFEPRYVDTIIRRWEKMTGEKAVLLENGAE